MATKDITDLQVCEAVRDMWEDDLKSRAVNLLADRTGQPEKVCWRAMERASDRGLLDYGVSLNVGWLTEQGKALLT